MTDREQPILDRLRDLIMSGEIPLGEELLEVPTAARLGISRTPLRPALAALAQEGLLQRRGARGYIVRKLTAQEILDAYWVRAHLEGLACALVAEEGLDAQNRGTIEEVLTDGNSILSANELTPDMQIKYRNMNERFHVAILTATNNSCLIGLTERTLTIPMLSIRVVHFDDRDLLMRSHDDHWSIFHALLKRQAERAKNLMAEHIYRSRDIIEKRFRDRIDAR